MILRVFVVAFFALCLRAQTNGNISGHVKDPAGAVVSGARITLTNQQTGASRQVTSDDTGSGVALQLGQVTESVDVTDARGGPRMNVNGAHANMNYNKFNGAYFNNPSRSTALVYGSNDIGWTGRDRQGAWDCRQ